MRILVTGGAGFIGSHLNDTLLNRGDEVVVIDNLVLGRQENICHNLADSRFKFHREDVLDLEKLEEIFAKYRFDAVFHLAANSDIQRSFEDPSTDYRLTFLTTLNVLLCMKKYGVRNLVFASTSAIYGESPKVFTEDYGPLFPVSHYGAAKLASEGFISSFRENYGLKCWIFRFPNVVGERTTHGVLHDLIKKLICNPRKLEVLGNGTQNKPYLYVKDLIDAILFCMKNSDDSLNYFNIGVDSRTRVGRIVEIIITNMGLNPEIIYAGGDKGWVGDVPEFSYDLSKLTRLGWKSKYTSDEAVDKAVKAILKDMQYRGAS
jgi:UDP-glucose 4-epimerase